jgi:hypothetical protein
VLPPLRFQHGRETGAASQHQLLRQTRQIWSGDFYDMRMEMRPCVVRRVSSGTRASREAEHHLKTTRGQGELPRAQPLKMWKQFGGLCMRIVGEQLRRLLQFYCSVLRRLREDIRRKRPELWHAGNWLLHDDNAPFHRALVTREFLPEKGIITLPHPPYSLDLAPLTSSSSRR